MLTRHSRRTFTCSSRNRSVFRKNTVAKSAAEWKAHGSALYLKKQFKLAELAFANGIAVASGDDASDAKREEAGEPQGALAHGHTGGESRRRTLHAR